MKNGKATFGVIVGTRGFFNSKLAAAGRTEIISLLEKQGYGCVIIDSDAASAGLVEGYEDAKICAELFREKRDIIDGVLIILPNFGDELGIINTLKLSGLDVPILVQASNDENDKVDVARRRDAFCGKISVCNNLYQYGIPFTNTSSHTCNIDSDEFRSDLTRFAAVCRVVSGVKSARIGAIGARPAAFQTVRFSEKLLQATGVTVVPIDLSEIIAAAQKTDPVSAPVAAKLESINLYGKIASGIKSQQIERQAKFSVVIDDFVTQNDLDATAIQCWDSIEYNYGCASCLSMSMMGEAGKPSACEMDVAGALSMLVLRLASGNAPGFLDWNNNFDYSSDKCVCTHCSNYPSSFMGTQVEIGELDIIGETVGRERCFGAVKGKVASGDMTYFRLSTDDSKGIIKAYGGEGGFTDDAYDMDGGIAVCHVPGLNRVMNHICSQGFEHHVAMVRGHYGDIIEEALVKYLKWDFTRF